jgi:hypothetical protein
MNWSKSGTVNAVSPWPGPVWALTKFCHSPQVILFPRRKPVEPYPKEVFVELMLDRVRHCKDILTLYWRVGCGIPSVRTPLLQEVRIALSRSDEEIQCAVGKLDVKITGGYL